MESKLNDGSHGCAMQTQPHNISLPQIEDHQGVTTATVQVVQVGTSRPRPEKFMVDESLKVPSNHLPCYVCTAIFIAVMLFISTTPLSLLFTCPLVYYSMEVRKEIE